MKCLFCAGVVSSFMMMALPSHAAGEDRSFDGTGNNLVHPLMGSAGTNLMRMTVSAYADGLSGMAGPMRPNPRDVSNAVVAQGSLTPNSRGMSDMVWQWGQFLDHDLDLTPLGAETADFSTSPGDPVFHGATLQFSRSVYDPSTGTSNAREQPNVLTSFLDGSMIYGSDAGRAAALRAGSGGRLAVTPSPLGDLMPYNTAGLPNGTAPGANPADFFLAGDVRSNEQTGLTAMHTLWVREHNRWADQIAAANPGLSDTQVYQAARKVVGAEIQKITYEDWIPALLGSGAMPSYSGYKPDVDPSVATEFSTAAFRIGHTMLSPTLARLDNAGNVIAQGNLPLRDAFFDPHSLVDGGGLDPILKGLASQSAQEIDAHIVDDVRNFLFGPFGPPGATGFDLASLNIQRGRDHGICDYNAMRVGLGLPAAGSFADVTSDPVLRAALESVYPDVNSIDPWVGMLAEDHLPGSSVGELMSRVILDQFVRVRDGDRFFYLNDPQITPYLALIESTTLGDIIGLNTGVTTLQANVFFVPTPSGALALGLASWCGLARRRRA